MIKSLRHIFSWQIFTLALVTLFCIRYIPLETRAGVSMIKTGVSFICLFFLIIRPPFVSKALILSITYFITVLTCVSFHNETFRWSTMLYLLSFIIVYIFVYFCFSLLLFRCKVTKYFSRIQILTG